MTPLKRAVENYSYDVADYLTFLSGGEEPIEELVSKTDSEGIIRLIKRVRKENSLTFGFILPLFYTIAHLYIVHVASTLPIFAPYAY